VEFYQPLDPTNQYVQHTDQVDMLIHSFGFTCPVPYKTYKTLCLTYEPAWHLDLCQNCPCLPLQQNNTLNTWKKRHLESFLKFTAPRPYKAIRWTYGEILHVEWCLEFPPLRPYQTNGLRYEESCHAWSFLKFTSPRPYLAPPSTNERTWHVESLLKIYSPVPYKFTFKVVQQTDQFWHLEPCLTCPFPCKSEPWI